MSDIDPFDHRDLDGRLLTLFIAVLEEGSVTRAAERLGVTQSAVSHLLDKLRGIVGDPLFVRSGRGIEATRFAQDLAPRARDLLELMSAFTRRARFDPAQWEARVTIAANDLQRDHLLVPLMQSLREKAPGVRLQVIPSGVPTTAMLRNGECDLLITPRPPDSTEVVHKRLLEDRYTVFFDVRQRPAPASLPDYLASEHVCVVHEAGRRMDIDEWLTAQAVRRRVPVTLTGFGGLPAFLRSGPYCCTMPSLFSQGLLHGFDQVDCPLALPLMPMYACWHQRHHEDPAQRWLRSQIVQISELRTGAAP